MEDKRRRTTAAPDPDAMQWRAGAAMSGKRDDTSIDTELPSTTFEQRSARGGGRLQGADIPALEHTSGGAQGP